MSERNLFSELVEGIAAMKEHRERKELDTPEGAREFFSRRASGATGEGLSRALDAVPNRPPDPGDELES